MAQQIAPDARIVYVDNDPLVADHARALLTGTTEGETANAHADAHDPEHVLQVASSTLDLAKPVVVMMLGLLNFILDDEDALQVVSTLTTAVPPGSYLVLTHPTLELGGRPTPRP